MTRFLKIFSTAAIALLSCFVSYAQLLYLPQQAEAPAFQPEQLHKQAPSVPNHMVFAGDTIRFDRSDICERMDRELITFTYMHTTSTLLLKRAPRYFAMIEPILKANGVPDDLKYLMVIESNLDPTALSTAKAAGLWQLTASTGKQYGLEVSSEVDERYNIEKETEAACKYLKEAYRKYGDWMTVAASYNAGQGGISSRLESQHQSRAMDLWLVTETSRYMFRILVAKMFFADPESFGFHVDKSETYRYFPPKEVVTVSEPIPSLVDFAEEHGVSYAQLKRVNLWLRDNKLTNKDRKTYRIVIPQDR